MWRAQRVAAEPAELSVVEEIRDVPDGDVCVPRATLRTMKKISSGPSGRVVVVVCIVLAGGVTAVPAEELSLRGDSPRVRSVVPAAVPYYTSDTGVALGFSLVSVWDAPDMEPREVSVAGTISQNAQMSAGLGVNLPFRPRRTGSPQLAGELVWRSYGEVSRYPSQLYTPGSARGSGDPQGYKPVSVFWKQDLLVPLAVVQAGPAFMIYHRTPGLEGRDDGREHFGLLGGGVVVVDSRDAPFFPRSGVYASQRVVHTIAGSTFFYGVAEGEVRFFLPVRSQAVLGGHAVVHHSWGDVPILSTGSLGGHSVLRGYPWGRYRGERVWAVQGEWRQRFARRPSGSRLENQQPTRQPVQQVNQQPNQQHDESRWGAVLFAGAGQARSTWEEHSLSGVRVSGGGGIRFFVHQELGLALRLDIAVSDQGDVGVYFMIKEAF